MKGQEARVTKLEQGYDPELVVWPVGIGQWDWTAEQLEAARAWAQEQADRAGGRNLVLAISYVKDWRSDDESESES